MELIAQGHGPVRQPAVRGPQGVGERVEGVAPLLELAELGTHLVEGAVLVTGAVLELLSSTNRRLVSVMLQCPHAKTRKQRKHATAPHLEDAPRRAAVDPQCLVQRSVESSAVVAELSP
jgi:hypothetical protein